jgi:hypothetical protein
MDPCLRCDPRHRRSSRSRNSGIDAAHESSTGIAAIQSLDELHALRMSITRFGSSGILISGSSEFMRYR